MRYAHMQEELDGLKLQIREMALKEKNSSQIQYNRPIKFKVQDILDYSPSEMKT